MAGYPYPIIDTPPWPLPTNQYFTGRKKELIRLIKLLQPGKVVTLCGLGGIGKSTLAIEAVSRLKDEGILFNRFPDGVIFHPFYTEPQADLALERIALWFGEKPQPTPEIAAQNILAKRRVLLILDGAEVADDLQKVLNVRGNCGILITSRSRKDAIDPNHRIDITSMPINDAVILLKALGGKRATGNRVVQRICELVGGLPLAVQLIGLNLSSGENEAQEYLEWLETTPLKALELDPVKRQHESVKLTIERNVAQISKAAQEVLGIVGLLAFAPFNPTAIAKGLLAEEYEVIHLLGEAVNFGLLLRPEKQYQISHALVHTYIREYISPPNESLKRLATYYVEQTQAESLKGLEGYIWLNNERPHFMSVLSLLRKQDNWANVVQELVWNVDNYLDLQGHWTDRRKTIEAGLQASRQLQLLMRRNEGMFQTKWGATELALGRAEKAIEHFLQALNIYRELGDRLGEANSLGHLGNIYGHTNQQQEALKLYNEALKIHRELGDRLGEAISLSNLANTHHALNQMEEAMDCYKQALSIYQKLGDRFREAVTIGNMGNVYHDLRDAKTAIEYYKRALIIHHHEIGYKSGEGEVLSNLGIAYLSLKKFKKAISCQEVALKISQKIGDQRGYWSCLSNLGDIYFAQGDIEKAVEQYQKALIISREIGDQQGELNNLSKLGNLYNNQNKAEKVIEYCEQILIICREIKDWSGEWVNLANIGKAYTALKLSQAIEYHQLALNISHNHNDQLKECTSLIDLGKAYLTLGEIEKAEECFKQALDISQKLKANHPLFYIDILCDLGSVYLQPEQEKRGLDYFEQALNFSQKIGIPRAKGVVLENLGKTYLRVGNVKQACYYLIQALEIFEQLKIPNIEPLREFISEYC